MDERKGPYSICIKKSVMRKALLIFILLPLSLVAQVLRESPGQVEVSGRVIDQGAKVLPGANVVFRN